jgi:small subunit ribosomal protein S4
MAVVIDAMEKMERDVPSYLQLDKDNFSVKLLTAPTFVEVPYAVEMQPHLITEYYSR